MGTPRKGGLVNRRMKAMEEAASGKGGAKSKPKPKVKKTKGYRGGGTVMGYKDGGAVCRANRS